MEEEVIDCEVDPRSRINAEIEDKSKMHKVGIEELDEGFIVTVGCKQFAFSDKQEMLKQVVEYVTKPNKIEREYRESRKPRD